jgi:anti-sigma B factor antagonist
MLNTSSPALTVNAEQLPDGACVVTLNGDIDSTTVPALRQFIAKLEGDVEISCEGVDFIDSAGLGAFVFLDQLFKSRDRHLALRRLSDDCSKLFEITGLAQLLDAR